jgi:tRNA G18 (ribose-2'-O)-methylase SpoU
METVIILDNIRSAHNVGSIFRTSDAGGVSKIYLCGVTPAPIDRFGRVQPDIEKVSLGAEKSVEWEYVSSTKECIEKLKQDEFYIVALEQSENSIDYKKVPVSGKCAIVLGEETKGLSSEILVLCDVVAEIPMKGIKESLNVATAFGIFLFRLTDI